MIAHVVLYRFPADTWDDQGKALGDALRKATVDCGLARSVTCGPHLPLPADLRAPGGAVHSFAVVWEFDDLAALDSFSQHPAMSQFVDTWVKPHRTGFAFANYDTDSGVTTQ